MVHHLSDRRNGANGENDAAEYAQERRVGRGVDGALASFVNETLARNAPENSKAILFGSRARGDARPDSDWDVLILLDKDRITNSDMDEVSYPICEFGWDADMMVNPIMYTMRDWEARRGTPFYKNVMKDGIPL